MKFREESISDHPGVPKLALGQLKKLAIDQLRLAGRRHHAGNIAGRDARFALGPLLMVRNRVRNQEPLPLPYGQ